MTFKTILTNLVSHLLPLSLVKQIHFTPLTTADALMPQHDSKPWLDADKVELTQNDFAC